MARRRWKCFSPVKAKGYQKKRSRSHRREFVRGGADPVITSYDLGNKKKIDWQVHIGIMMLRSRNISHFTLEAMRRSINRNMQKAAGRQNFHLKIRSHPHRIYREHTMMSFAGADRLSSGMRNGFGRPVGTCARVNGGQVTVELMIPFKYFDSAVRSLQIAKSKIGTNTQIVLLKAEDKEHSRKINIPRYAEYVY